VVKGGGREAEMGVDVRGVGEDVAGRMLAVGAGVLPNGGVGRAITPGALHPKTRMKNSRVKRKSLLGRMVTTPISGNARRTDRKMRSCEVIRMDG
jgi:hypothetical protein